MTSEKCEIVRVDASTVYAILHGHRRVVSGDGFLGHVCERGCGDLAACMCGVCKDLWIQDCACSCFLLNRVHACVFERVQACVCDMRLCTCARPHTLETFKLACVPQALQR